MTFLALAAFASAVARASEPVVDCVEVKTRSADNPLVKVWYRVPRDYDPSGKGRMRTLILFGGRNCDGKAEVSGKLGWTEWADLNGIFLVAPTLDFGDRPRMTPYEHWRKYIQGRMYRFLGAAFPGGCPCRVERDGARRSEKGPTDAGEARSGFPRRSGATRTAKPPARARVAPKRTVRRQAHTHTDAASAGARRGGGTHTHTHADGADEENMAGALSSQTLQHYQV